MTAAKSELYCHMHLSDFEKEIVLACKKSLSTTIWEDLAPVIEKHYEFPAKPGNVFNILFSFYVKLIAERGMTYELMSHLLNQSLPQDWFFPNKPLMDNAATCKKRIEIMGGEIMVTPVKFFSNL